MRIAVTYILSRLAWYCRLSVCLYVCLWWCALWVNDISYNKSVWRSEQEVPTRFYIIQPLHRPFSLKLLLNHRLWCHLAYRLKPYHSTSGIASSTYCTRLFQSAPYDRLFLSNNGLLVYTCTVRVCRLMTCQACVINTCLRDFPKWSATRVVIELCIPNGQSALWPQA